MKCNTNKICKDYFCINARTCLKQDLTIKKPKLKGDKIPVKVKRLIKEGHLPECKCCGTKEYLTFDHIIPKSKEGTDSLTNGQILCTKCNLRKGDKVISINELRQLIKFKINY